MSHTGCKLPGYGWSKPESGGYVSCTAAVKDFITVFGLFEQRFAEKGKMAEYR
jgi:hypothetical protein